MYSKSFLVPVLIVSVIALIVLLSWLFAIFKKRYQEQKQAEELKVMQANWKSKRDNDAVKRVMVKRRAYLADTRIQSDFSKKKTVESFLKPEGSYQVKKEDSTSKDEDNRGTFYDRIE